MKEQNAPLRTKNKFLFTVGIISLLFFMVVTGVGLFFWLKNLPTIASLLFLLLIAGVILIGGAMRKEKSRKWKYKQIEFKERVFRWAYLFLMVCAVPFFIHGISMATHWSEKADKTTRKIGLLKKSYLIYKRELTERKSLFETRAYTLFDIWQSNDTDANFMKMKEHFTIDGNVPSFNTITKQSLEREIEASKKKYDKEYRLKTEIDIEGYVYDTVFNDLSSVFDSRNILQLFKAPFYYDLIDQTEQSLIADINLVFPGIKLEESSTSIDISYDDPFGTLVEIDVFSKTLFIVLIITFSFLIQIDYFLMKRNCGSRNPPKNKQNQHLLFYPLTILITAILFIAI